jgi:hypothetical protein
MWANYLPWYTGAEQPGPHHHHPSNHATFNAANARIAASPDKGRRRQKKLSPKKKLFQGDDNARSAGGNTQQSNAPNGQQGDANQQRSKGEENTNTASPQSVARSQSVPLPAIASPSPAKRQSAGGGSEMKKLAAQRARDLEYQPRSPDQFRMNYDQRQAAQKMNVIKVRGLACTA